MNAPALTAMPPSRIVPSVGSVVMTTPAKALPSAGSEKPKSAAVKARGVSSTAVSVASVPDGASLTLVTEVVTALLSVVPATRSCTVNVPSPLP